MIYFYSLLFILIFYLLLAKKGLKFVILIDLFFQIFTGTLNESFDLLLKPSDWIILIIFINLLIFSFLKGRTYFLNRTFIDYLLLLYFLIVLIIPLVVNYYGFNIDVTFKYFIPIRFWMVYRNYYCFFKESEYRSGKGISVDFIFSTLLWFGMLSALLSISRFFSYPGRQIIESLWPVYYENTQITMAEWGRLSGTMSATNGTGNYFCFLTAISLLKLDINKRITWLFPFLFGLVVILSGSFSSIAALCVILFVNFRNKIFSFRFMLILVIILTGFIVLTKTDVFRQKIEQRIATGYRGEKATGILPSNLVGRLGYWSTFVNVLVKYDRIYFGLGPGGFFNYQQGKDGVTNQNAESFYFRILNESGLFALLYMLFFFFYLFRKVQTFSRNDQIVKYQLLFFQVIIILLVAGVANETLYYGANTSLFGLFLGIIGYLKIVKRNVEVNKV